MESCEVRAAITFDLHDVDAPEDIRHAATVLARSGLRATFFIPSSLLGEARYRGALEELPAFGHEVGSHSHAHDRDEFRAMTRGECGQLDFLARSRDLHAAFFGCPPTAFRAPFWARLAPATARALAGLGYRVDSSATPQRLPFLGSSPFAAGWMFTPRAPYPLAPGLLEIPTSCVGLPAAAPTYVTVRRRASLALLELLRFEAWLTGKRVLVTMLHVEDLNPDSKRNRDPGRFGPLELLPLPTGGFGFRHYLRERDPARIAAMSESLVAWFARLRCGTMTEIADAWSSRAPLAAAQVAAW